MKGYIYRIDIGPKYYYGQTIRPKDRRTHHSAHLRRGTHCNPHMQNSYDKYGTFSFNLVLTVFDSANLDDIEQGFLDDHVDEKECMNVSRTASGKTFSEKFRSKISAAHKGRIVSAETRARISAAGKGRKYSKEARANMSAAQTGKTLSAETRAKIANAARGRSPSLETRAKLSASGKGRKLSESHKAKLDRTGAKLSSESKAMIGRANSSTCYGRPLNEKEWVKFASRLAAAKHVGGNHTCIVNCVAGRQRSHKGWEFVRDLSIDSLNTLKDAKKSIQLKEKPCYGRLRGSKEWVEFSGRSSASRHIGCHPMHVGQCVNGKTCSFKGWEFVPDLSRESLLSLDKMKAMEIFYGKAAGRENWVKFYTAVEAAEYIEGKTTGVTRCLSGNSKTCKGWEFTRNPL